MFAKDLFLTVTVCALGIIKLLNRREPNGDNCKSNIYISHFVCV